MAEVAGRLELRILALAADRDVHIGAQIALLHVAVAGAQIDQDGADLLDVSHGLFGRTDVRTRHDLHQGRAGAVQVDIALGRRQVVDQLARILFQMQPLDADVEERTVLGFHLDHTLADDREIELADLIAGGQVGVEIVLPVELAAPVDLRIEAQAGADGLFDTVAVQGRQHAGETGVDQRHLLVRACAEADSSARKQLGLRGHLGVDFQAHDDFPSAGAALDEFGRGGGCVGHGPVLASSRP